MLAVNYSTLRGDLKNYFDRVIDDHETIIVTRKNERNVVILSLSEYNDLKKTINNFEYINKLTHSLEELDKGELFKVDLK